MCLGVPGQIVGITDPEPLLADRRHRRRVRLQDQPRTALLDDDHPIEACIGDWVLVHVGFALARIDEAEAAETLRLLTLMGEMQAAHEAMRASASAP